MKKKTEIKNKWMSNRIWSSADKMQRMQENTQAVDTDSRTKKQTKNNRWIYR